VVASRAIIDSQAVELTPQSGDRRWVAVWAEGVDGDPFIIAVRKSDLMPIAQ
jgi:hypothetical protein